jgi:hypothetical protein
LNWFEPNLKKNLKQFRIRNKEKEKEIEKNKRPRGSYPAQLPNRPTAHPESNPKGYLLSLFLPPTGGPHLVGLPSSL